MQLPSNTRWFSKWTLVKSIKDNEDCLKSTIWDQSIVEKSKHDVEFKKKTNGVREILFNDLNFWKQVTLTEQLLAPLADAILNIEGSVVDARTSYKSIDAAFESSLAISQKFEEDKVEELKEVSFKST